MGFIRANNDDLAAHIGAQDPHSQYLLERALALGLHHNSLSSGPFDANTWNPNQNQKHKSAINVIHVLDIRQDAQGTGSSTVNLNLPQNQQRGALIDIDPFADQSKPEMLLTPQNNKTQVFVGFTNFGCFIRQQRFGNWDSWRQFIFGHSANSFSQLQKFVSGIQIGGDGQATPVRRILTKLEMIDPPAITPEGVYFQDISIPGAQGGDFVQISPVWERLALGLWPFDFAGVVLTTDLVRCYFRNEWTNILDLQSIQFRIMVTGF